MKYIIWFTAYIWNGNAHPVRNYVLIQQDSIEFYVWDFYYTKWRIDYKLEEVVGNTHRIWGKHHKQLDGFKAIYLISYHGIRGIAYITSKKAEIVITWRDGAERIELLWLPNRKLKHLRR